MAIDVFWQTIDGKRIQELVDPNSSLARIWPCGDPTFPLLQYIDPYGNAVFNGLQMPEVRKEIGSLTGRASSEAQKQALRQIQELTLICGKAPSDLFSLQWELTYIAAQEWLKTTTGARKAPPDHPLQIPKTTHNQN